MSLYWLTVALLCFIIAAALVAVGYIVPRLLPFTEALIASLFGVFVALGIAILAIIEGPSQTRLGRRGKIIERASKAIISDATEKILGPHWNLAGGWVPSCLNR